MRDPVMVGWVQIALFAIAANAVLIQTIVTDDSPLKNMIRGGVLLITVFLMFTRHTLIPTWLLGLTLFSAVLLLLTGNTDQLTLVYVLLLVPALWSIPERDLTKAAMLASLFALLLVFALLLSGLTSNELRISQTYVSADIRARYTFGTAGVPFFMNVVYGAAVFVIYYVFRWRLRGRNVLTLITLVAAYWIYTQTDGRGGFLSILVFCGLAIIMPTLIKGSFLRGLLAIQPVIFLGFGIWLASQGGNGVLNGTFSFRPLLYGHFLDSVTVWDALLSTTVKQGEVTTVDSSYLHLLFGGGVVLFIAFCLMFARAILTLARRGMALEIAFITSVMSYAVFESILLRVENVFIVFTWYLILRYCMRDSTERLELPTNDWADPSNRHRPMGTESPA